MPTSSWTRWTSERSERRQTGSEGCRGRRQGRRRRRARGRAGRGRRTTVIRQDVEMDQWTRRMEEDVHIVPVQLQLSVSTFARKDTFTEICLERAVLAVGGKENPSARVPS